MPCVAKCFVDKRLYRWMLTVHLFHGSSAGLGGSGLMIPSESRYHQPGPVAVILVNSGCSAAGLAHRRVPRQNIPLLMLAFHSLVPFKTKKHVGIFLDGAKLDRGTS